MQEMDSHIVIKNKPQQPIGDHMKHDRNLGTQRWHPGSEQTDNDYSNHRDVIEPGKHTNKLPQPLRRILQQGCHHKRKQCDDYARNFGNPDHRSVINRLLFQWRVNVQAEQRRGTVQQ